MSDYTPTTELVRHNWGAYGAPREEFDQWLAEVERAAAAKAWDEGADSAFYNPEIRGFVDYPDENPYRREETQ